MEPSTTLGAGLADAVLDSLDAGTAVRLELDGGTTVFLDRPLPFLYVHRRPRDAGDAGTSRLLVGESAFVLAAEETDDGALAAFVKTLAVELARRFKGFLLVEVWAAGDVDASGEARIYFAHGAEEIPAPLHRLQEGIGDIERRGRNLRAADPIAFDAPAPPGREPLLGRGEAKAAGCLVVGLELPPWWRDDASGELLPRALERLRAQLSRVLQRTAFEFITLETTHRPRHVRSLGRRRLTDVALAIDRRLAEIDRGFEFLLSVTPVNVDEAWTEFERARFDAEPVFHERFLAFDPDLVKRELFDLPLEEVEDPTVGLLLREKRQEMDRQLAMLEDRDTRRFVLGSLQLYGGVEADLVAAARLVLEGTASRGEGMGASVRSHARGGAPCLSAADFAARAREEIAWYATSGKCEFGAGVRVRDDVPGVMVSDGVLLVGRDCAVTSTRVAALLEHEVGTHVLTWNNGRLQPLRLMTCGLAGYEELQEGLGILAEWFAGGLSAPRMRTLAARVLAVAALLDGASFVDTFRMLTVEHRFSASAAFTIAMRVHRSGGLTKDAIYMRGLRGLLGALADGVDLRVLWLGKFAAVHVPLIEELVERGVLTPARVAPRYAGRPDFQAKLESLRRGRTVLDLLGDSA